MITAHWVPDTNWGDAFTPFLFKELFELDLCWTLPNRAQLFACGSLLERIPHQFNGWVLGSGAGDPDTRCDLRYVKKPLLLRGPLTAQNCALDVMPAYGDPGLLARLVRSRIEPNTKLGIVPHYTDYKNAEIEGWIERGALSINIKAPIVDVVHMIERCEKIVSSSLHGLVIAHTLGIPCAWARLSDKVLSEFKFHDYYAAYGIRVKPAQTIKEAEQKCFTVDVEPVYQNVMEVFKTFYESCLDV